MYKYILFDLDGTLTDSSLGITESVRKALIDEGYDAPIAKELTWVVGPSLRGSFATLANTDNADVIERLMKRYRDRFEPIGMFENKVYDGIKEVLQTLVTLNFKLCLATSKPKVYAVKILRHFGLDNFFHYVGGAMLDGSIESKEDVIQSVLDALKLSPSDCLMVGDREYDMHGAQVTGMDALGVTYGFGSEQELKDAGATFIAHRPEDLIRLITSQK